MAASAPTPHATGAPAEGRCGYYVAKKKRFCRMTVAPGRRFCGEHAGAAEVCSLPPARKSEPRFPAPPLSSRADFGGCPPGSNSLLGSPARFWFPGARASRQGPAAGRGTPDLTAAPNARVGRFAALAGTRSRRAGSPTPSVRLPAIAPLFSPGERRFLESVPALPEAGRAGFVSILTVDIPFHLVLV